MSSEVEGELRGLLTQAWLARAVCAAAELGLGQALANGPLGLEALAGATATHPATLRRLLRVLGGIGLVERQADGRFAGTEGLQALVDDTPGSLGAVARLIGAAWHWGAWGHLTQAVRTGRPGYVEATGRGLFEMLGGDSGAAAVFNRGVSLPPAADGVLLGALPIPPAGRVIDVGGGNGSFLLSLLAAHPALEGVVVDLPGAVAAAKANIAASGATRCTAVEGDFFKAVPAGGALYLLRWVLHNWADERAVAILRTLRAAMGPDARLAVAELALAQADQLDAATIMDLEMLAICEGRERTIEELSSLAAAAGLRVEGVERTPALIVYVCRPV